MLTGVENLALEEGVAERRGRGGGEGEGCNVKKPV